MTYACPTTFPFLSLGLLGLELFHGTAKSTVSAQMTFPKSDLERSELTVT